MEPEVIADIHISLPTVEGEIEIHGNSVYDDSVDVQIEQSKYGKPYCQILFSPAGPCEFTLMGFTATELDELGKFLIQAAKDLTATAKRQEKTEQLFKGES